MEDKEHLIFLLKMKRRITANTGVPPLQSPIMIHNLKQVSCFIFPLPPNPLSKIVIHLCVDFDPCGD